MSNDLEVTHGGAVAVDTMQLWTAAAVLAGQTRTLREVAADIACVRRELWGVVDLLDADVLGYARSAEWLADATVDGLSDLGHDLGRSAQEYEEVELRVHWQFARLHGDDVARVEIEGRAVALGIDVETLGDETVRFGEHATAWWEMAAQYVLPTLLGGSPFGSANVAFGSMALAGIIALISGLDRGTIPAVGMLGGPAKPVVVTATLPGGSAGAKQAAATAASGSGGAGRSAGPIISVRTTAPTSLAMLAGRIPNGPAQVSIERFAMPGGRTEWAVYVAGTRTSDMGGAEPWDMKSNTELYLGERSASSDAVFAAMRAAGVQPDQPVHLVGHSQGGMIAANVAMSGEFEVGSLTTFGSPVDAEVPESVLSVRVRHDDDPVAALAGVGSPVGGGSPDSVVISRTGNSAIGLHDLGLPMHGLDAYARTAEMYQSSGDVRVAAVERLFTHLGSADDVTRTDYVAVRRQSASG